MAKISVNNLASAIYESLKDKENSSYDETIINAVNLINDKHMLGKKDLILDKIQSLIDERDKVIRARVRTRTNIEENTKKEIREFIKKKYDAGEVILECSVEPKLLGGMKIEVGDEIIDMTLKGRLDQLQKYLITTQ